MENVILVDCEIPLEWEFHKALEEASNRKWTVIKGVSNRNHGGMFQRIVRYLKYFLLPCKIFRKRNKISSIVAWQQFYGLILAFYFRLFNVKSAPQITVMTFIYKPKEKTLGSLYLWFMRYIVTSGFINKFIVFSTSEKKYYAELFNVPEDIFSDQLLGVMDEREKYDKDNNDDQFYLSVGRSNRDYGFLIDCWNRKEKLKIICDTCKNIKKNNIEHLTACHGEQYLQQLAKCYAVIIPLEDEKISSGQLVILHSMMMGKPIIITKNDTVDDYVNNKVDGLIIEKEQDALQGALNRLDDSSIYRELSRNARKSFEEKYSLYAMGWRIGQIV